jgi:DNA polymerase III sliding clamp (beta) subunit (PCNA family)
MPNPQNIEPYKFKKGQGGRPKGALNYRTRFLKAATLVAEALKLGKEPDAVELEIVKRGIIQALKGNFNFYKDILDRLYGQAKQTIEKEEKKVLVLIDEEEHEKEKGVEK